MTKRRISWIPSLYWSALSGAFSLLLVLAGCGQSNVGPAVKDAANESTRTEVAGELSNIGAVALAPVRDADLGKTRPAHSVGQLYLAGFPAEDDFPLWRDQGVETVVTLLSDEETGWDEEAQVRAAGMEFIQIPYGDGDEVFDQTREVLRNNGDRPLVLHCKASNRVGAVWLTHRVLDQGADLESAILEANEAGLRSSRLRQQAVAYIQRQQSAVVDGIPASD